MAKESAYFTVEDVSDIQDAARIKRELDRFSGVNSVSVAKDGSHIAVDYDSTGVTAGQLEQRLEALGGGMNRAG